MTFLVVQCIRICLPKQRTWVPFLVWEDSTCCGAIKPVVCATATEACMPSSPGSATREVTTWDACALQLESGPRSPKLEKACVQQRRPRAAKNKIN